METIYIAFWSIYS